MTEYVLGFLFNWEMDRVVLIRKTKPEWQRGLLNGVGGKIEPGETPVEAMVREFREETSVDTLWSHWIHVARMSGPGATVQVFAAKIADCIGQVRKTTEEPPVILTAYEATSPHIRGLIPNLRWLIPMSMNALQQIEWDPL